jgi:iron(III) transport system permease protein
MASISKAQQISTGANKLSRLTDRVLQWGLGILVAALVLFPTIPIIYQSFLSAPLYEADKSFTLNNFVRVLSNSGIWNVIGNTLMFMLGSTLLGTAAGIFLAVLLTRTDVFGRRFFSALVSVPFYISALILAFAWSVMYGPQGYITVLARNAGLPTWNLYSLGGMIFVSAIYFMPLTYLYCSSSLKLADPSLEYAARIGGANPLKALWLITIPLIRPAILYSLLLTLVSGVELLSIPLVLGEPNQIDVLSTYLYRTALISGLTDYGSLAVVALLVVIFVTILVTLQNKLTQQEKRFVTVGGKVQRARLLQLGIWKIPATILMTVFVFLFVIVPLAGIVLQAFSSFLSPLVNPIDQLTFDNFKETFEFAEYRESILNSLFVAGVGGVIATLFMALCSLLAYRSSFSLRGLVKYLALYPRAFPGTVIGLGFLWALLMTPAVGWLRNTLWILIIAYCMRYLPLGFSSVSPSVLQISDELDRAARVSGTNWIGVLRHILFPLLRPALLSTFLLLFITFLKEYSVALFLFARGSQVIGTTMLEIWAQGGPGPVAALAVIQLLIIALASGISRLLPSSKIRE